MNKLNFMVKYIYSEINFYMIKKKIEILEYN